MAITREQAEALLALADAVTEAVRAGGEAGVPGGVLYAALLHVGLDLERFEHLMSALVAAKRVRRSGQLYFTVR